MSLSVKSLKYLHYLLISPIRNEWALFIHVILLMILPNYMDTFYFGSEGYDFIYIIKYNVNGSGIPYVFFIPFLISYFVSTIINIASGKFQHILRIIFFSFFLFLFGLNCFLLFNFGTLLTPSMLVLFFETNALEAKEFVSVFFLSISSLCSYLLVIVVCVSFFVCQYKILRYGYLIFYNKYLAVLLTVSIIYLLFRSIQLSVSFSRLYQFESVGQVESWADDIEVNSNTISVLLYSLQVVMLKNHEVDRLLKSTYDAILTSPTCIADDSLNVILVIGESYSKFHSHLYGYSKNTTPKMDECVKNGNMFVFSNVISPYNLTSSVIKNLMSTNSVSEHEYWSSCPFFPAIFKHAGYTVYFWDNQLTKTKGRAFDFSLNGIIHDVSLSKLSYDYVNDTIYNYDGDLISSFFSSFHPHKRNLIILHLMGQHVDASDRFPSSYHLFSESDVDRNDLSSLEKQRIADYDNATLYNDYVLSSIINYFDSTNAVLIYLSDHGEEVYDYRHVLGRTHEFPKKPQALHYQYEVPFVIWCSDMFSNRNESIVNSIKTALSRPYMTDNVCNLLFHIGSIETNSYREEFDIISPHYNCKKRIVEDRIGFDDL